MIPTQRSVIARLRYKSLDGDEEKFLYVGPQGPKCFPEMQLWKEICFELTEFLARYLLSGYIVVSKKVLFLSSGVRLQ